MLMNTRELAEAIKAPEHFVRRQIRQARAANRLEISYMPGEGHWQYVDTKAFAAWLRTKRYTNAAAILERLPEDSN